jgi:hypothetical protein
MELKDLLKHYRDLTFEILRSLENEEYDNADNYIEKRQKVICNIDKLSYSNKEFKKICNDLKLLLLEQKLAKLMNEERCKLKSKMNKISNVRNVNKCYNKKHYNNSVFFNKEI